MPISFSKDEKYILEKIQSYCHYQERCIKEVRNKLFSLKATNKTVDKILQSLIDNDYLNEDRYASMFIQGKLRIKKWGRIKLKYELRLKGLDINIIDENINKIKEKSIFNILKNFQQTRLNF